MAEQGQALLRNLKQCKEGKDTAICAEWLEQLHALTKSPAGKELAALFTRADLAVLAQFGFGGDRDPTAGQIPALRCLNNVLVYNPAMERMFVDEGLLDKAIDLLSKSSSLAELGARLLLRTSQHLLPYLAKPHLSDAININVARYAEAATEKHLDMSCVAHLSLMSVLAARYNTRAHRFFGSLDGLFQMLGGSTIHPEGPLEQPVVQLIDCLAILLPLLSEAAGEAEVPPPTSFHADKLVDILDCAIRAYRTQADFETRITPLVSLMYHVSKLAPATTKKQIQSRLLATDRDRDQPLGQGDSLAHLLVNIATEAVTRLKPALAVLLLELSDGNPDQLVHNVGFGCAAGLLQCLGLPLTAPLPTVDRAAVATNPITGQRQDMEPQTRLPDMTPEEKEREAERLFVLFERLKRTGVVSVQNPVAQAVQSGRIQELESNSDSD